MTCFAQKGYHQTTLDDIAGVAGLSKGGIYVYFDSKWELYIALFDWVMEGAGITQSLQASGASVYEKLVNGLTGMAAAIAKPDFRRIAPLLLDIWMQNLHDPQFQELSAGQYNQFREPLTKLIAEGIAAGEFKQVDATALANILLGLFDGLMVQMLIDDSAVDFSAVSQTLPILLEGLCIRQ